MLFVEFVSITFAGPLPDAVRQQIDRSISADYASLEAFYKDLHRHPELSLMEQQTAAKLAERSMSQRVHKITS